VAIFQTRTDGPKKQIFGSNEQVRGPGSDLLKRYQPEGDVGEAKNKPHLPPPQSEELMELKLDDATEFVAALTGERHD
jgi:hypothetical protein